MKKLVLVALAAAAGLANADVLVYEGFSKTDYPAQDGGYVTASDYPSKAEVDAIGVSSAKWAGMGGSQIKVYGANYGLSLPSVMTAAGFTTTGGAVGANRDSNNAQFRAMNHKLAASNPLKVSDGKLYVRLLLNLDSVAAEKLSAQAAPKNTDGGYFGFGVMKAPGGNDYYLLSQKSSPSAIGFAIWKDKSNPANYNISLMLTSADGTPTNYQVLEGITLGSTYICYAELSIGAGTDGAEIVRAGAQAVDSYVMPVTWAKIGGVTDSVEVDVITDSVYPDAMGEAGPYGSNKGYFRGDELRIGTEITDVLFNEIAGTPGLADASLSGDSGEYEVSAMLTKAKAYCGALAVDSDGNSVDFSVGEQAAESEFAVSLELSRLSADATYEVYAYASNDVGVVSNSVGVIYNGTLSLTKVRDAEVYMLVNGEVTVSRAHADAFPLSVNYGFGTTHAVASEGVTWKAPGPVEIPAGATSATLTLEPLVDPSVSGDVSVTMTNRFSYYNGFSPATVDLTIKNVVVPSEFNVWLATEDGDASVAANWSKGRVPDSSDAVLFDGYFSNASCVWDSSVEGGPSATVSSWTQRNGYAGMVTLKTVFPGKGDFTCLTVTDAMTIDAGTLTHPQSVTKGDTISDPAAAVADLVANETYRIRIAVGSLSVGASGKIDAMGKGYYMNNNGSNTMPLPSHGGVFSGSGCQVYGNPKEPIHVGLPYKVSSGTYTVGKGGGAIYITSSGAVTVNGIVRADSSDGSWASNARGSGAAGSVYINAASLSGTGSITADGLNTLEQNNKGVGGRVAIVTQTPVDRSTFAAISAKVNTLNNSSKQANNFGGAGTVYFKDGTMTNGKLVVAEKSDRNGVSMDYISRYTFVGTDGDWTFDSVEFAKNSYLVVPAGTSLHLPAGLSSVSSTATGAQLSGFIYKGGVFDIGSIANQTMSGNWMLVGWSNLVLNANITVSGNAAIGVPPMAVVGDNGSTLPSILTSSVMVNGDLTVASDGRLPAFNAGFRKSSQWASQGVLGHSAHGGRIMAAMSQSITCKSAYDSVFAPSLPGCGIPWPNGQGIGNSGGAMKLVVSGAFTMNGVANASGEPEAYNQGGNAGGGSGGAIDITAGSISGSGSITADGGAYGWMSGPGGRIAVKLTDANADFSQFSGLIRATGRSRGSHAGAQGSAGTVYLKAGNENSGAGTLKIACPKYEYLDDWNSKTSTTEIVSLGYGGDEASELKRVKLLVSDWGRAAVNTDVQFATLTLEDDHSYVDFEGHTLTVARALVNGSRVAAGEHDIPAHGSLAGFPALYNSVDVAGKLIIRPGGLQLIIR